MRAAIVPPIVLAVLTQALVAQGPGRERKPIGLQNFTFQEKSFTSPAVAKEMPYGIYLPKDYDKDEQKDTRWPLVIWLHGMWEDHQRFHERGGAPVLDQAVTDKKLPPCVFVLANGDRTSMYINAGPGKEYQDLIEKDLLEHIGANYRVSQDRRQHALMGISMGGMAALRIGFTRPELFGAIAVHSSAVFPLDPDQLDPRLKQAVQRFGLTDVFGDPIDKEKWAATNPLGIAQKLDAKALGDLRLYFDAGTEDRYQFGKSNQALHQVLEKKKIEHTWELVQGGGHAWGSGFQEEKSLMASLAFVGESFAKNAAKGATSKKPEAAGNGDGKEPPRNGK